MRQSLNTFKMKIFIFCPTPIQSLYKSNLFVIKFSKSPKLFAVTISRVLVRSARTHREIQALTLGKIF